MWLVCMFSGCFALDSYWCVLPWGGPPLLPASVACGSLCRVEASLAFPLQSLACLLSPCWVHGWVVILVRFYGFLLSIYLFNLIRMILPWENSLVVKPFCVVITFTGYKPRMLLEFLQCANSSLSLEQFGPDVRS